MLSNDPSSDPATKGMNTTETPPPGSLNRMVRALNHELMRKPTTAKWTIEYDNDTGSDDGGFWEWWKVTNGEKSFKSDDEADAKWLAGVLNARDEDHPNAPHERPPTKTL